MKKTYIQPSSEAIMIRLTLMQQGSPNPGFDPDADTGTMDSRRRRHGRDVWEDDEELEEEEY